MTESQPAQPAPPPQPESPPPESPPPEEAPPIIPPEMPAKSEWIERGDPNRLERREVD